jgi:hypothetical protein
VPIAWAFPGSLPEPGPINENADTKTTASTIASTAGRKNLLIAYVLFLTENEVGENECLRELFASLGE